jgi:hypothetical protein
MITGSSLFIVIVGFLARNKSWNPELVLALLHRLN